MATKKTSSIETKHQSTWTLFRLYFFFATLAGLFGTLIGYGIMIVSATNKLIITDNEFVMGKRYYEMNICKDPMYDPYGKATTPKERTEAEIQKCQDEKKSQILIERSVSFKEDLLGGGIWGTLFLLLFLYHYPRFMRQNKQD